MDAVRARGGATTPFHWEFFAMGWDPWGDIQRAAEATFAPVTQAVDRALSTNLSGENRGGMLARFSEEVNRSDPAKYVGGLATSAYRFAKTPLEVASDVGRGDFQNAGTNLGRGIGAGVNAATGNVSFVINQNQDFLRSDEAKKWTLGISEDLAGAGNALRTQEDQAYVSDADRNSALRLGAKAWLGYAAAPLAASAGNSIWAGVQSAAGWVTGGGLATAGGMAVYDQLKKAVDEEGTKALQDAGIIPKDPETPPASPAYQVPVPFDGAGYGAGSGYAGEAPTATAGVSPLVLAAAAIAVVVVAKKAKFI